MALRALPMVLAAIAGTTRAATTCDVSRTCAQEEGEEVALLQAKLQVDAPAWPKGDEAKYDRTPVGGRSAGNGKNDEKGKNDKKGKTDKKGKGDKEGKSDKKGKGDKEGKSDKKGKGDKKSKGGKKGKKGWKEGGDDSLCGIEGFSPYPGYSGDLRVGGKLWVKMLSDATEWQEFTFRLSGVDPKCSSGPGPSPNSCGVFIHEGTSCAKAGGHHWNKQAVNSDPWGAMTYTSWEESTGEFVAGIVKEPVMTGLAGEEVIGRTVVVHDFLGARIACAPLVGFSTGNPPAVKMLGDLKVTSFVAPRGGLSPVDGSVTLNEKPGMSVATTGVYMSYKLNGVDERCNQGPGEAENSCGVRLHEGSWCWTAGNQLFNSEALLVNPWSQVSYIATKSKDGTVVAESERDGVNLGLPAKEISGRVLMVYDFSGQPMACGTITV